MQRAFRYLVIILWLVGGPPSIADAAQNAAPAEWQATAWTSSEGLPQNSVHALAQTPDRYLWVGTRDGLARFDGNTFTTYHTSHTSGLPDNHITDLAVAEDGTLWVGTAGGLARYRDGSFESLSDAHPAVTGYIRAVTVGPNGTVWAAPEEAVVQYQAGTVEALPSEQFSDQHPPEAVADMQADASGHLWMTFDDAVAVHTGNDALMYTTTHDGLPESRMRALGVQNTTAIVGTQAGHQVQLDTTGIVAVDTLRLDEGSARTFLFNTQPGYTWVADRVTLSAQHAGERVFTHTREREQAHRIRTLFEDHEGTVWVGTEGGGLIRFHRPLFSTYGAEEGLSYDVALSVSETQDSTLWIGTNCGGLNRWDEGTITPYVDDHVPDNACLYSVLGGRDGALWIGHSAVVRISDDEATRIDLPYDRTHRIHRGDVVKALYEDPVDPDVMWVGTIYGLYRLRGTQVEARYTTDDGLPANRVQYIHRSEHTGALWLSTREGLARYHDDTITAFTPDNGFPSTSPRAIHEDADGNLWIGTYGDGLIHHNDGTFTPITEADGLFDSVVSAIVPDAQDRLWMSGNRGIYRTRLDTLQAFIEGTTDAIHSVGYGEAAGLGTAETSGGFQPAAHTDATGRIWFPTLQGVAVVDPEASYARQEPPATHVTEVRYQNETFPLPDAENTLPMGQRSFEIGYTGINLSRPDAVRFQYKLNGFDADWQSAEDRRTAFYTNIPPGTYTFQVRAANEDGQWSAPTTLTLTIPSRFYETWGFAFILGLLVLGAAGIGYHLRIRTLQRREQELQQRVSEQTAALRDEKQRTMAALETVAEQKESISALNEAKSEFFANVSHEFRTPLTVALGLLEEWIEAPEGDLSDAARADLKRVLLQNRRLLRLVNQLLDIARLESHSLTLHVQQVDLQPFLKRIARTFEPLADQQALSFSYHGFDDASLQVPADPEHLETVIVNLLSNAFKFTPSGGSIRLTLDATSEWALLRVADTGPGISEADQDAIFERFAQAHTAASVTGTGIGLALVKALTERHGGDVSVESSEGDGSTFTVRWPRHSDALHHREDVVWADGDAAPSGLLPMEWATPSRTASSANGTGTDDARPTVLLVDDNADIRAYMRRHLASDYRVIEAENGEEGLAHARTHTPDCIVSDVMMPVMDGVAMLQAIRNDTATDFLPVVLLTARAELDDKISGLEAGADDYLTKPFRPRELRTRIRTLIEQRMRLRERFQSEPPTPLTDTTPDTPPLLADLRQAIHDRLSDPEFTVQALAEAVGMSRSKLYRDIKDVTEHSPSDLIWEVRLQEAHRLLASGKGNVSEVAYGVGFKSVSHFTNRFRERYDEPPSKLATTSTTT